MSYLISKYYQTGCNVMITSSSELKFSKDLDLRKISLESNAAQNFKVIVCNGSSLRKRNCASNLKDLMESKGDVACGYICSDKKEFDTLKSTTEVEYVPSFLAKFNHKDISTLSPDQKKFLVRANRGYYSLSTFNHTKKPVILLEMSNHEQSFRNLASVLNLAFQEHKKIILYLTDSLLFNEIESKLLNSLDAALKDKTQDRFRSLFVF